MAPPNSVVCEVCVQETREERREREMGGMKTDGEMDREKANVAKWLIWLKGIWEFLLYTYL